MTKFLFIVTCLSMFSCSKSDQITDVIPADNGLKSAEIYAPGTILNFSGNTLYHYVKVIDDYVLADGICPNEMQITFQSDNDVEFLITENGDCGGRSFYAYGKITPSGVVTFEYAVPVLTFPDGTGVKITDVIMGHLGCTLSGPGISKGTLVFCGKFDGSTLITTAHFNAKCPDEWPANNIFPTPVEGPIQCTWTYDMSLVE